MTEAERIERDDLALPVALPPVVRRVVSLVPSLTEALAATAPGVLAGATDWCVHPPGLDVPRFRGTKNPDVRAIAAAGPDLVVLNQEENRELDHRRLRAAGVPVWVTVTEDVPGALRSLRRLITVALRLPAPAWLDAADARLGGPPPDPEVRAAICVWRDPWMVVGSRTFAADLLRHAGAANVYAGHADRYPRVTPEEILARGPDVVVLPDEPYAFTAADGPEAFPGRARLVSGRHLTWYGPSLVDAVGVLRAGLSP
ncbi:MAG TPA: helical backbone metal receptor [Streptosporangiaceae bacterium]|jgi:ABC-type Fe3+-hydroxamate transport system substrate-binding protein